MNRLDGKVALVSGASRGIGAATARLLAEAGARVVATVRDEAQGAALVGEIAEAGGEAMAPSLDVTREADWERVMAATLERFGRLDVLVNNAGVYQRKPIDEMTLEEWRALSAVNLEGVFLGTKHGIRAMKESAGGETVEGSIVNISSIAGINGVPFASAYSMSKGGVRLFSKSTALECAQLGYRIRVNSVHPGVIETDMADQLFDAYAAAGTLGDIDEVQTYLRQLYPADRFGTAEEVARAVLFLASDHASFITGTELLVDGGFSAR